MKRAQFFPVAIPLTTIRQMWCKTWRSLQGCETRRAKALRHIEKRTGTRDE